MSDDPSGWEPPVIEMEITDELDLHTFRPSEIGSLIPEYIEQCVDRGFASVRIIHGKGTGSLAKGVHALLKRDPRVLRFELGGRGHGSWGATVAWLVSKA